MITRITRFAFSLALSVTGCLLFTQPLHGQAGRSEFQRGIEASSKGDFDLAIASFSEAIRLNPIYVPAYNNRGNIYKAKGDYDKAIPDYNEAIRLDATYVPAYINRGIVRAAMGDNKKAMADYNEAVMLDPGSSLAYVNRGLLSEADGDYQKAFADFDKAVHLDSGDALAYNNLAWLLATCPQAALRDGRKAVEFAKKACELAQGKNPDWVDTLAAAYAEAGDFARAIKWETEYLKTPRLAESKAAGAAGRLKLYQAGPIALIIRRLQSFARSHTVAAK